MVGYYASPGIIGHMRVSNPSNLTTHFGPNSFIGVLFLYNFVILVGQVGHKNTWHLPTALTQSKDSSSVPIDAKSDLASIPHINTFDTFVGQM